MKVKPLLISLMILLSVSCGKKNQQETVTGDFVTVTNDIFRFKNGSQNSCYSFHRSSYRYVILNGVNLRKEPDPDMPAFATLPEWDIVYLTGNTSDNTATYTLRGKSYTSNFAEIITGDGDTGWIFATALGDESTDCIPYYTKTANNLSESVTADLYMNEITDHEFDTKRKLPFREGEKYPGITANGDIIPAEVTLEYDNAYNPFPVYPEDYEFTTLLFDPTNVRYIITGVELNRDSIHKREVGTVLFPGVTLEFETNGNTLTLSVEGIIRFSTGNEYGSVYDIPQEDYTNHHLRVEISNYSLTVTYNGKSRQLEFYIMEYSMNMVNKEWYYPTLEWIGLVDDDMNYDFLLSYHQDYSDEWAMVLSSIQDQGKMTALYEDQTSGD